MAKQQHDRLPDTLTRGSGPELTNASTGASVLHIRLWAKSSDGSSAVASWPGNSPAACLILDLIKASGGFTESTHGLTLSARYPTTMLGMLMARRLQWALQGFAEAANDQGTGAAILIELVQNSADPSVAAMLSNATPGQILLGSAISGDLGSLPGLAVRETAESGWSEVLWRGSGAATSYPADEQDLVRMIQKLGRQDPGPPKSKPRGSPVVPGPTIVKTPETSVPAAPDDQIVARAEKDTPSVAGKRRWLIVGGAAAAAAIVAVLLVVGLRHKSTAQSVEPVSTSAPAAETDTSSKADHKSGNAEVKLPRSDAKSQSVAVAPRQKATDSKERQAPGKPLKGETQADLKTAKVEAGSCDLTEGEIPRSLERARNDMHQGKLYEAQSAFLRVLGCPSAREGAQAGLSEVRRKLEVQGLPLNPE
jgi:hypothetical protein